MGIELYFSNHLNILFNCLQINIKATDQHFKDIFEADQIVVLNSHTRKWLQLNFAKNNHVMANMKFPFLEAVLWGQLQRLDDSPSPADFLNKDKLRIILYEILMNELPDELTILNRFISHSVSNSMKISRVWMLAEKIASLLMEYEYQRPEMIETWFASKYYLKEEYREIETAQRYLYLLLLHPETGLLQKREKPFLTLFQYYKKIFSKPINKKIACKPVHLFAISQVSVFHQKLLSRLKNYFDFHIYAFNPCGELWEDISSPREDIKFNKVNRSSQLELKADELEVGALFDRSEDNFLLKAWGKTGREYTKLMSQLVDYQFYPGFTNYSEDLNSESMLQRVKRHILFRCNGKDEQKLKLDNSIQIFNAPNKIREVQTVYQNILYHLQNKPELKLQDIAILVPNLDDYKTSLLSVFSGSNVPLKFDFAGTMAISDSLWANGLLELLNIARGDFNRKEIFTFLRNPCVMAKFNYSDYHYRVWVKLVDELNIYHHFNSTDKKSSGYSEDSFYTWKQGLLRMRMGNLFDNNFSASQVYPEFVPHNINDANTKIDTFILIIEAIHNYVEILRKLHEPKEWVELLGTIANTFLAVPEKHQAEALYMPMLSEKFNEILSFDRTAQQLNKQHHVNLTLIYEYLVSALAISDSVRGGFLNGGVVISELQPMRPFSFKITYILGLSGDEFPGRDVSFPLDLRICKRHIGDILNSDRNRYHFLENLISTTDCLYLSWVNKNLTTDETKVASSVILQLKRYLINEVLSESDFIIHSMPLHSYRLPELRSKNTLSCNLYQTFSLPDHVAAMKYNGYDDSDIINIQPNARQYFKNYLSVASSKKTETNAVKIKMKDLEEFLLFPASSYFNFKLKQETYPDENLMEQEVFEPLSLNRLQKSGFDKKLITEYFDKCLSGNSVIPIDEFCNNSLNDLFLQKVHKSEFAKDAFGQYIACNYGVTFSEFANNLEQIAERIAKASHYFSSLSFGQHVRFDKNTDKYYKQFSEFNIQVVDKHCKVKLKCDFIWFENNSLHTFILRDSDKLVSEGYSKLISYIFLFDLVSRNILPDFDAIVIHTIDGAKFNIKRSVCDWRELIKDLLKNFINPDFNYLLSGFVYKKIGDKAEVSNADYLDLYKENFESTFFGNFSKPLPDYLKLDCMKYPLDIRNKLSSLYQFTKYIKEGESL